MSPAARQLGAVVVQVALFLGRRGQLRPTLDEDRRRDVDRLGTLAGRGDPRVVFGVENVVAPAHQGRVGALFVAEGEAVPGRYDPVSSQVETSGGAAVDNAAVDNAAVGGAGEPDAPGTAPVGASDSAPEPELVADLVDYAAAHTLRNGGRIHLLDRAGLRGAPVGALLRF